MKVTTTIEYEIPDAIARIADDGYGQPARRMSVRILRAIDATGDTSLDMANAVVVTSIEEIRAWGRADQGDLGTARVFGDVALIQPAPALHDNETENTDGNR